jgi:hypothetical protein
LGSPIVKEDLPYPQVHYPNHYGTFHAFGKNKGDFPVLCECTKGAVANYIRLRQFMDVGKYSDERVTAPLSSHVFPNVLAEESLAHRGDPMVWLRFAPKLCHRCNLATPSGLWCHEMYGGQFKQTFGWYIAQTKLRIGVMPGGGVGYLEDACPSEVIQLLEEARSAMKSAEEESARLIKLVNGPILADISPDEITYWRNVTLDESRLYQQLSKKAGQVARRLGNYFENITREEFGFRKVGDAHVNESLLLIIVSRLFPRAEINRHHRPDWLAGLELDLFLPKLRLAFEYQGQQHFHPVKAWGGKEGLDKLRIRDAKKRDVCIRESVSLIAIDYTEPLTETHVKERIRTGTYMNTGGVIA